MKFSHATFGSDSCAVELELHQLRPKRVGGWVGALSLGLSRECG